MGNCKIPENPAEMGFFPTGNWEILLIFYKQLFQNTNWQQLIFRNLNNNFS